MDKISQLLSLQEDKFEQIKKAQINYGKSPKSRITLSYLDTRLENLEKTWQMFRATHDNVIASVTKEQRSALRYFADDIFDVCEETYMNYKSDLKNKIKEIVPVDVSQKSNQADIKLPTITIPTFTGKYTEWPSFHDMFSSLIHSNNSLDNVQKLHYLKSCLSGEAEQLLRGIPITNDNYFQAWESLKNRFNNKRYISNCIFKKFFGMKTVSESASQLKYLLDSTVECLFSLKNLGLPTQFWDAIVIYWVTSKLDPESYKLWEQHLSSFDKGEFTTLDVLKQFLESRFRTLEMIDSTTKVNKSKTFHSLTVKTAVCAWCKDDHYIYQCKEFSKRTFKERHEFVQDNGLCFNCLTPNHTSKYCKRDTSCQICHRRHHSLLHPEKRESVYEANNHSNQQDHNDDEIVSHFVHHHPGQILLATALVEVTSRNGQKHTFRALVDQGSQASFVTEEFVQTTGLKRVKINGKVSGLSEGNKFSVKYMVEAPITSKTNSNFTVVTSAYVLKSITNYLPTKFFTVSNWAALKQLPLADPNYNTPSKIDILLGADVYCQIIDSGLLKGPAGIIAQNTVLGWILSGDTGTKPEKERQMISMHVYSNENDLLKRFWEVENEVLSSERKLTKEEEKCEEIYRNTTSRTECGRYKVYLPFKDEVKSPVEWCGQTKEIAAARFLQLERRFKYDKELKNEYKRVMNEYLDLNHMSEAEENKQNVLYLPHHPVVRNDKDTTKVRVVYDASSNGSKGHSLNNTLYVGPVLQKNLRTLIMEWRRHKIALVGDIVKMYRQVRIADDHAEYQRILWRANDYEDLKSYKLLTVTFGTASAPYLAVRTLLQVAEDEKLQYPIGSEIVKGFFYMDDLITGADTVEQAIEIYTQVRDLLRTAGFEMQKWSSNSNSLLEKIKQPESEIQKFEIKFDIIIKILGLYWDRTDDRFKFFVELPNVTEPITKRKVLSDIARLFDPFGWLSPTIIKAKIFMQKLWLCDSGWDEELATPLKESWLSYRKQLHELEAVQIERWIFTHSETELFEIHGFADASTSAYAAVLYVKVTENDKVYVKILESKTKVAPLKQISVARLELCAAVLLARLLHEASNTLKISQDHVFAYTDSTVVLSWIQAEPRKWKTFVANRVTEIQIRLNNDRWRYVSSEENPADVASRGVDPCELKNMSLWWNGPSWLKEKNLDRKRKQIPSTNLEEREPIVKAFYCADEKFIWERFSNLTKMVRVLTFCRRLLRLRIRRELRKEQTKYLTCKEMRKTLDNCLKLHQEQAFKHEIDDLKERGKVKGKSKLISLAPYLDKDGLLRVGGRLQAAKISSETKHPIILSNKCYIALLLVKDAHTTLLHGGVAMTMNYIRSRYWIIGLKPLVKRVLRQCVTCIRYRARTSQPQMGELPGIRLNPGKPFRISGVDFAGPIQLRHSKGRGRTSYKGYISLFICTTTKAIHLEAVTDLTSQGFLAAFRRFVSRRGHCSDVYSDNGLNFVGAARELSCMFNQSKKGLLQEVVDILENDGTTWHFIPPRAPNFGGLWEAGIKSVKGHLLRVIGNTTLTYEEISTLLSQIESCLNSRPICQLSDDSRDVAPLTPGHFLIGEPTRLIPDNYKSLNETLSPLNRWRAIQRMVSHFWVRWSKEYLHTLQQRYKWQIKTKPLQIGDVVIVKEDHIPPSKWLLAKISKLHEGPDGGLRVVTVKTKNTVLKRPVSKLILLPSGETYNN